MGGGRCGKERKRMRMWIGKVALACGFSPMRVGAWRLLCFKTAGGFKRFFLEKSEDGLTKSRHFNRIVRIAAEVFPKELPITLQPEAKGRETIARLSYAHTRHHSNPTPNSAPFP